MTILATINYQGLVTKGRGTQNCRHRTMSHLGVPLIKMDVSAMSIPSMWNIPRNETNQSLLLNQYEGNLCQSCMHRFT